MGVILYGLEGAILSWRMNYVMRRVNELRIELEDLTVQLA